MDLSSFHAALSSRGVPSVTGTSIQAASLQGCIPGLANPEPSGTIIHPGQHLQFPAAAHVSESDAPLEDLMGRMNPTSYGATESHLQLMGKIPLKTFESCREPSERTSRSHW